MYVSQKGGCCHLPCAPSDMFLSGAVIAVGWICASLQYRDVTMDSVRLSIKSLIPLSLYASSEVLPSLSIDRPVLCVLFIPDLFLFPQTQCILRDFFPSKPAAF